MSIRSSITKRIGGANRPSTNFLALDAGATKSNYPERATPDERGSAFLVHRSRPSRHTQRLRKWLNIKAANMTDLELLEMILVPVVPRRSIRTIVPSLLEGFETFGGVLHTPADDLLKIDGMTEAGTVALKTIAAAALHLRQSTVIKLPQIRVDQDLANYLVARQRNQPMGDISLVFLDGNMKMIMDDADGGNTSTYPPTRAREIMRRCLKLNATNIIVAHNHPTGASHPSRDDVALIANIAKAASAIGVGVIDHIIVGRDECFSLRASKFL